MLLKSIKNSKEKILEQEDLLSKPSDLLLIQFCVIGVL